jgi:ABC-type uncharacterized transport system permease subunit
VSALCQLARDQQPTAEALLDPESETATVAAGSFLGICILDKATCQQRHVAEDSRGSSSCWQLLPSSQQTMAQYGSGASGGMLTSLNP